MQLKNRKNLPIAIALAATTALSFGGGALWSASAGPAAAAEAPAAPQHGWLGMAVAPLTDQVAQRLGIPKQDGAVVLNVFADGPAAKAGVQKLDVIKSINGVTDPKAALDAVKALKPGDVVQLAISRSGQSVTLSVTAGEAPKRGDHDADNKPGHRGGPGGGGPAAAFGAPELKDIPAGERFDHLLGGSFSIKDKDGKTVTYRTTPGKVVSATDTQLTITPNGQSGNTSYTVTQSTHQRGKASDLKAGDKVVVETRDGSTDAVAIHEAGERQGPPPGAHGNAQNGQPGQRSQGNANGFRGGQQNPGGQAPQGFRLAPRNGQAVNPA